MGGVVSFMTTDAILRYITGYYFAPSVGNATRRRRRERKEKKKQRKDGKEKNKNKETLNGCEIGPKC